MNLMSLADFAAKLTDLTVAVHEESALALEHAAQVVEAEAKASISHLQDDAGPFVAWADLKPATIDEKVRLGLPPDINAEGSPLERTGAMRDSIQHAVAPDITGGTAHIGSNDPVAEYQELGTEHIPPRSFLGGALFRKTDQVKAIVGAYVVGALVGDRVHNASVSVIEE
jgi:HK97 gp10 family phage protein